MQCLYVSLSLSVSVGFIMSLEFGRELGIRERRERGKNLDREQRPYRQTEARTERGVGCRDRERSGGGGGGR